MQYKTRRPAQLTGRVFNNIPTVRPPAMLSEREAVMRPRVERTAELGVNMLCEHRITGTGWEWCNSLQTGPALQSERGGGRLQSTWLQCRPAGLQSSSCWCAG